MTVSQPDGSVSTISFVTVGGRTSAVVDRVQVLPEGLVKAKAKGKRKKKAEEDEGPEEETITDKETTPKKKRSNGRTGVEPTEWKVQMIETVVTAAGGQEAGESDEVKREVNVNFEEVQTENSRAIVSLFSRNVPSLFANMCFVVSAIPTFQAVATRYSDRLQRDKARRRRAGVNELLTSSILRLLNLYHVVVCTVSYFVSFHIRCRCVARVIPAKFKSTNQKRGAAAVRVHVIFEISIFWTSSASLACSCPRLPSLSLSSLHITRNFAFFFKLQLTQHYPFCKSDLSSDYVGERTRADVSPPFLPLQKHVWPLLPHLVAHPPDPPTFS